MENAEREGQPLLQTRPLPSSALGPTATSVSHQTYTHRHTQTHTAVIDPAVASEHNRTTHGYRSREGSRHIRSSPSPPCLWPLRPLQWRRCATLSVSLFAAKMSTASTTVRTTPHPRGGGGGGTVMTTISTCILFIGGIHSESIPAMLITNTSKSTA